MAADAGERDARRPRRWRFIVLGLCGLFAFSGFVALGNWQLQRRVWKLDLIQRVDERVHAVAEAAPERSLWPLVSRESDEYRHVFVEGEYLPDSDTLVTAATELGSGYWVLTPLRLEDGSTVMVNRGFIGQGSVPAAPPVEPVKVEGLLRITEPDGSVLQSNVPAAGRWYSRDVAAIAAARGLEDTAPYFIDAAAGQPGSPGAGQDAAQHGPVGGLTVIRFHNSHLVYAITWFGLAAMVVGAAVIVAREERRGRDTTA